MLNCVLTHLHRADVQNITVYLALLSLLSLYTVKLGLLEPEPIAHPVQFLLKVVTFL